MALQTTTHLNIDFYDKKYILVNAKQYDKNSRLLSITCYNQGKVFPINSSEHAAYIKYRKPDNHSVFNLCEINRRGEISVKLTEQMLISSGICSVELVIVNKGHADIDSETGEIITIDNASVLSTMVFYIDVSESAVENTEIESSYEYNGLNEALEKAEAEYTEVIQLAKSYAIGNANGIRENEDYDNAKYYYQQSLNSANEAKSSEDAAYASEQNAKIYMNNAEAYKNDASISENNAEIYMNNAKAHMDTTNEYMNAVNEYMNTTGEYMDTTKTHMDNAKSYMDSTNEYMNTTKTHMDNAKSYMDNAKLSEQNAKTSEANAKLSEQNAKTSEANAKLSEQNAKTSETNALDSANKAKDSEDSSYTSEQNAKSYMDNALVSEQNAEAHMNNAKSYMDNALASKTSASTSEQNAKVSETNALNSANKAQSYAVGGTGIRNGEDIDNAQYYYEMTKTVANGLNSGFIPIGTISFSELATAEKATGFSYNINDDFTTDDTFREGAGKSYTAGTNVYYTADGYWDCFGGATSPTATVDEVKDYLGI